MTEYTVLSTKVEKEVAKKVQKYCQDNGLTPSSLLKALIEEELNKRKPLTAIYNEMASWQKAVNQAIINLDERTNKLVEISERLHKLLKEHEEIEDGKFRELEAIAGAIRVTQQKVNVMEYTLNTINQILARITTQEWLKDAIEAIKEQEDLKRLKKAEEGLKQGP